MRFFLLLPLVLAGCTVPVGIDSPSDNLILHTDQTAYLAPQKYDGSQPIYGFNLVAQLENRTGQVVYLSRCYPDSEHPIYSVDLVGQEDDWGAAYNPAWACVGHDDSIAVAPGTTRIDTLHIRGPVAWDGITNQHFGVLEGWFRLNYGAQSCHMESGCPLPGSRVSSNAFEVKLSQ